MNDVQSRHYNSDRLRGISPAKRELQLQEFSCEICGGQNYRGRREFERHFREWRHQNGMRALGIPNNKNFFEITKMQDAKELWENIQVKRGLRCCVIL